MFASYGMAVNELMVRYLQTTSENLELKQKLKKSEAANRVLEEKLEESQALYQRDHEVDHKVTLKLLDENLMLKEKLRCSEAHMLQGVRDLRDQETCNDRQAEIISGDTNKMERLQAEADRIREENQTFANSNSVLIKSNRCLGEEVKRLQRELEEEICRPVLLKKPESWVTGAVYEETV